MENKIIVLDIDGTLLPSNNIPDEETSTYLKELDKTNTIVLASSRGYHDLVLLHTSMGISGPIISNNGGSLDFFDNHESVCMSISKEIIDTIFQKHIDVINSAFYSYHNKLFIYNRMDKLNFLYKINPKSELIEGDFSKINLVNPNNIYFILDNNRKTEMFETLETFSDEIIYVEYGHDKQVSIVIVNLKNTNKAYAILELLLILNKKEQDLIVFGDGEVDCSMLSLDGTTVAMCNAPDEVKACAKYITDFDCNNQGVLKFLKKMDSNY